MKNLFTFGLLVFCFSLAIQANAQEIETKFNSFKKIENTNFVLLNMDIMNPQNSSIEYWKVRGYCEDAIDIYVDTAMGYDCNKSIRLDTVNKESLMFLLYNKNNANKLNLRLKAYNKEGKRVYSDNKLVLW